MQFFDSHCHLNFPDFESDRDQVLQQCFSLGVKDLCIPATRFSEWASLLQTPSSDTRYQPQLHIALGLHPCFLDDHLPEHLDTLDQLLTRHTSQVVAIGEAGLDFYDKQLTEEQRKSQLFFLPDR